MQISIQVVALPSNLFSEREREFNSTLKPIFQNLTHTLYVGNLPIPTIKINLDMAIPYYDLSWGKHPSQSVTSPGKAQAHNFPLPFPVLLVTLSFFVVLPTGF